MMAIFNNIQNSCKAPSKTKALSFLCASFANEPAYKYINLRIRILRNAENSKEIFAVQVRQSSSASNSLA